MTRTTAEVIAAYRPRTLAPEAAAFARRAAATLPATPMRAKALLFAAGRLGSFALLVGLPLDETLFATAVIERFITTATGSPGTRRTLRTNLRALGRANEVAPSPAALCRERAKPPYSDAEIASYLALADAQPTALRRQRATALVSLGAGAGLVGAELRSVRGSDICSRSGGVVVTVAGKRARFVPVRAQFGERLVAAASFFGPRPVVAGPNPDSHNVTSPLIGSLSGGTDLPRLEASRLRSSYLETSRLRSSYLVAIAEEIRLRAFMDAAGITSSQRLGDLVSHLPPLEESKAVALLGGRR
jgi:integrase